MIHMIDYIEVYYDGDLIGYIGQDIEGEIHYRAKDDDIERILNSFVSPIRVESAYVEGSVSVSKSEIMLVENPDWINYLEYNLPSHYTSSTLYQTSPERFSELEV